MPKHVRRRRRNSATEPAAPLDDASSGGDPVAAVGPSYDDGIPWAETSDTMAIAGSFDQGISDEGNDTESLDAGALEWEAAEDMSSPEADWFGPSALDHETYAARRDVSLASMLMLGADSYQRIDGMGLARKALEAPSTGDSRLDLTDEERWMLANGRAWCMLVHGDLGHRSRLDDPFVVADAERYVEIARGLVPESPHLETTTALLRLRQGRTGEALESAQRAIEAFALLPDHRRSGRTQGDATLAVLTFALVTAESGYIDAAQALGAVCRAIRTPVDVDDVAFAALMTQLEQALGQRA